MMKTLRRTWIRTTVAAACAAFLFGSAAVRAEEPLTFFGWSDQHVQTDGKADHLLPAIDAMNALPGANFPEKIGGKVAAPAFVIGCGDITEWPTNAAKNAYEKLITGRLKFPSYDIVGNHDEGGNSPSETVKKWIIARHGALRYTFDKGGVHFIALYAEYDESLNQPAQPVAKAALDFLRADLAKTPKGTPVIVAMHLCYDAITNKDDLVKALDGANVLMVLGGHYHKAKVDAYRGIRFVQLPSPAPNGPQEFTVVRIAADRLVAIPYDYKNKKWSHAPGKVLDVKLEQK